MKRIVWWLCVRLVVMTDMVQLVNIHPPRPFEYSDGSRETAAARWKVWVRELNVFFAACNVVNEKQKLHVLLNQAPDLQEIYYAKWEDKTKYDEVVKLFKSYFAPQSNKKHAGPFSDLWHKAM